MLIEFFELTEFGAQHDRNFTNEDSMLRTLTYHILYLLLPLLCIWILDVNVIHLFLRESHISKYLS